jgi:hypothetical protein
LISEVLEGGCGGVVGCARLDVGLFPVWIAILTDALIHEVTAKFTTSNPMTVIVFPPDRSLASSVVTGISDVQKLTFLVDRKRNGGVSLGCTFSRN